MLLHLSVIVFKLAGTFRFLKRETDNDALCDVIGVLFGLTVKMQYVLRLT